MFRPTTPWWQIDFLSGTHKKVIGVINFTGNAFTKVYRWFAHADESDMLVEPVRKQQQENHVKVMQAQESTERKVLDTLAKESNLTRFELGKNASLFSGLVDVANGLANGLLNRRDEFHSDLMDCLNATEKTVVSSIEQHYKELEQLRNESRREFFRELNSKASSSYRQAQNDFDLKFNKLRKESDSRNKKILQMLGLAESHVKLITELNAARGKIALNLTDLKESDARDMEQLDAELDLLQQAIEKKSSLFGQDRGKESIKNTSQPSNSSLLSIDHYDQVSVPKSEAAQSFRNKYSMLRHKTQI